MPALSVEAWPVKPGTAVEVAILRSPNTTCVRRSRHPDIFGTGRDDCQRSPNLKAEHFGLVNGETELA